MRAERENGTRGEKRNETGKQEKQMAEREENEAPYKLNTQADPVDRLK